MAEFIQVGFTATRDPGTGEFLPAVPLFIEKTASAEQGQAALVQDLGKLFAHRMRQYIEGGGLVGDAAAEERRKKAGKAGG
jgi:3'-phosphoadenosine 5'-phosphosulfate sulfotransferase (PAPS reductase)/FAD synthetase